MEVKISKGRGKTRTEFFEYAIIRIGSDPTNHVRLAAKQAAPFHLQILNNTQPDQRNYLVNLTDQSLAVTLSQEAFWLGPFATSEIRNGDMIEIGDYQLVVNLPIRDNTLVTSRFFEAELAFPTGFLLPDTILEGVLTIKNTGEQRGCKFYTEVEGLPEDCVEIDPVPLLYPGAKELIPFRLLHQSTAPEAGYANFIVTISSPESYPEQKVVLQHKIYIAPSFRQQLRIIEAPKEEDETPIPIEDTIKQTWKSVTFESVSADQREKSVAEINEEAVQEIESDLVGEEVPVLDRITAEGDDSPEEEQIPEDESADGAVPVQDQDDGPDSEVPDEIETMDLQVEPPPSDSQVDDAPGVKIIGNKFKDFWDEEE